MFAVRRYTNQQGENIFVPTFGTEPSQPIPEGFTLAPQGPEGAQKILQKEGLSTTREASEDVLMGAGLMAPRKKVKETATTIDTASQLDTETKVDTADKTTQIAATVQQNQEQEQQQELKNYLKSTEPPTIVTSASVDHLTNQLRNQYTAIQKTSGYKYKNEKELDSIFSGMAAKLAVNGINDIRDIGVEEVVIEPTVRTLKHVNIEKDPQGNYSYMDYSSSDAGQRVTISADKIKDVREIESGSAGGDDYYKRIELDILEGGRTDKVLINKVTGKRLKDVAFTSPRFRNDLAANGEFSTSLAKKRGDLSLEGRGGFTRWGKDVSVKGQADYAIEFVDGNAVMMPVWKDTKTDLTPFMMMGSIALMAAGVPAQIGGTLAPTGASVATKAAIGNAVVAGGMTALAGGDLEDIAKAAVLSGGMSYASAHLPAVSKTIGETIVGKGVPGAVTVGTAITNAGVNGIAAMIMKQDVGKAMLAGAVQGAVQVNASDFLKSAFGEDVFKNLSNATNLSDKEMEGLFVRSLSRGAGAMAYNRNFFTGFRDNLLREGLSLSAANAATKGLSKNLSKDQLKKVHRTVRQTASLAILAKQRGLNVSTVLESAYPKIILNTLKD
jgi:hypothetical protein